jgi:hypothetical protein
MAQWVNVGARYFATNSDIPSKKALKEAFAADPLLVVLYDTSEMSPKGWRTGANLDTGVNYQVTGPNPYNKRDWYATVTKRADGKITVK